MSHELSIVIPAYNEALRLPATLEVLQREIPLLAKAGLLVQKIIVVNDGSLDATFEVAKSFQSKLPLEVISYRMNRGKGHAVRVGALAVTTALTLVADADMSTPWTEAIKLYPYLLEGAGIVIASRAVASSQLDIRQPWYRETMGKTFNLLMRLITGLKFHDTQCGFKLLDNSKTQPIWSLLKVDRFAWDIELLVFAKRRKVQIVEVGVIWNHMDASRVNPITDSLEMLWSVVKIRLLENKP